MKVEMFEQSN